MIDNPEIPHMKATTQSHWNCLCYPLNCIDQLEHNEALSGVSASFLTDGILVDSCRESHYHNGICILFNIIVAHEM